MTLDRESELALDADAAAAAALLTERGGHLHAPSNGDAGTWWAELHPASDPGRRITRGCNGACTPERRRRSSSPPRRAG